MCRVPLGRTCSGSTGAGLPWQVPRYFGTRAEYCSPDCLPLPQTDVSRVVTSNNTQAAVAPPRDDVRGPKWCTAWYWTCIFVFSLQQTALVNVCSRL